MTLPRRWHNETEKEYLERIAELQGEEFELRAAEVEQQVKAASERAAAVAAMEPWVSPALVEPVVSHIQLVVKGKISNARFLEAPPYNARKVRNGTYWSYELEVAEEQVQELVDRLEGNTLARAYRDEDLEVRTGIWCEEFCIHEDIPVHPAYQGFAELLSQRPGLRTVIWHDTPVDGNEAHQFALEQIRKLQHLYAGRPEEREIAGMYADVWREGGDAYGGHRPRLQELNNALPPARRRSSGRR